MNRLTQLFSQKNEHILNVYYTAGFPSIDSVSRIAEALQSSGADIIELGMPYSDPLADGETIQKSSEAALKNGMNLDKIFNSVKELRSVCQLPIILMGYYNQLLQYGDKAFFKACKTSGVDGLIIPDLPLDVYESNYQSMINEYDLTISFLVTPQTSDERIKQASELSSGFLYVVSQSSITGAKGEISDSQIAYFDKVNNLKGDTPSLIGFGIHNKQTFNQACSYANGAIIGSEFIRVLERSNGDLSAVEEFVRKIKS